MNTSKGLGRINQCSRSRTVRGESRRFAMLRFASSVAWLLAVICVDLVSSSPCPANCRCKVKSADQYRVDCKAKDLIKVTDPSELPRKTVLLDLSRNKIKLLRKKDFLGLASMKKLLLARNEIRVIEDGTFMGLNSLTRLILSYNKIIYLNATSFQGLSRLKNLDLSHNNFVTLPDGVFSPLQSIKRLLIDQVKNLLCDCQLQWFVKYIKGLKVDVKGKCFYPKAKQGESLTSLKAKDMTCASPLELPVFQLSPSDGAITIIEGDQETFSCIGTWRPKTHIQWYKDTLLVDPGKLKERQKITTKFNDETMLISSKFEFKQVTTADTGTYKCKLTNPSGFIIREIQLQVLNSNSRYCRAEITETNRGTFRWYDTVAGGVAQAVCPHGNIITWVRNQPRAYGWRNCSATGEWMNVEGKQCAFANQRTQLLYKLAKAPMNSSAAVMFHRRLQLHNVTSYASQFETKWDVIYASQTLERIWNVIHSSQTLERISPQIPEKPKMIAKDVVVIISNMMEAKASLLSQAQMSSYRSCSNMVLVLETFRTLFPGKESGRDVHFQSKNVVYQATEIEPGDSDGKTCAAFSRQSENQRAVECIKWQNYTRYTPQNEIEASVHFPPFPFRKKQTSRRVTRSLGPKLQFIVYRNGKLFPNINSSRVDGSLKDVATSVVLLRAEGMRFSNLTQPIVVKLKNHQYGRDPIPVYWDFKALGGIGSWVRNRGCKLSPDSNSNYTIVKCHHFGGNYLAVMMVVKAAALGQEGLAFFIHPVVYFGAAVCALLLLVTLLIYIFVSQLRFNRDDAAMLMNECLALLAVVIVFVTGINNVTNTLLCRAVGVLLHYFLLCALLWVGCGGICLHRLIRTSIVPEEYNPVLRYYMISWGVPLIVCGITVAGNPDNYNVQDYCWLKPNPFLGAFVGPACLVLLVNIIVLIRLRGLILQTFDALETERQESDLPEEETAALSDHYEKLAAIETLPSQKECMDHVLGSGFVLLLIVLNVACGIILVVYQNKLYLNIVFSCIYALANILLGVVIFVFHCGRKSKVKSLFGALCKGKCCSRRKYVVDNDLNADDVGDSEATAVTTPLMNGEAGGHVYEEISNDHHVHGATTAGSDNVSLPSSAALTVDRQLSVEDRVAENDPSLSDKHSCVSAPLPLRYSEHIKDRPPGYRHSFCDAESVISKQKNHKEIKTLDFRALAPLALPESTTPSSKATHSSRESVPKHGTESVDKKVPSDRAPSERSFGRETFPNTRQGSRTPSEASVPQVEKKASLPGASSEVSIEGKPTYLIPRRQKPYNFIPMASKDQQYKLVPKQAFYVTPPIQENPGRQNRPVNGVIYDFPQGSVPPNLPFNAQQPYLRQNYQAPVPPSDMNPRQRPRGNSTDSDAVRDKKNTREGTSRQMQESLKSSRTLPASEPKEVRAKPEPKEWIPPSPKFVYVPVPHILKKQKQTHSETCV